VAAWVPYRRTFWVGPTVVAVVLALMAGYVAWTLNPASLKPRLAEAVWRATGRTLTISGAIGIKLSLVPTVTVSDVALADPPGFSRPDMVKVERMELSLALLPLLRRRFEVDRVTLVRPDLMLETDPAGHVNWAFARPAPRPRSDAPSPEATPSPETTPPSQALSPSEALPTAGTPERRFTISFQDATVLDGRVAWIDPRSGHSHIVQTPRLTIDAPTGGPVEIAGDAMFEGQTIGLTARAEPVETSAGRPWRFTVSLRSAGATATMDGQIARPLEGRQYSVAIDANVPDPAAFAPWFPQLPLTSLHAVTAHAEVTDADGPVPTISALQGTAGTVDLGAFAHGARLEQMTLNAHGQAPIKLSGRLMSGDFESGIGGNIGDLRWLANGATGPVAVDLEWNAAAARASVKGMIKSPSDLSGFTLDVAANVPNPSLAIPNAPPGLKSVLLQARLTDAPGPMPFQLTSSAGDLTGDLSLSRYPRLSVEGQVSSRRLDLDALRRPAAAPSGTAEPPGGSPGSRPDAPPGRADPAALLSHAKLPFDLLRALDASVKFSFANVRLEGTDIGRIEAVAALKDGQLRLDPVTIDTVGVPGPGQHSSGILVADAARVPPMVHLSLDAPAVPLRPLLAALGLPQVVTGAAAVRADLTGTGDSPHAIAASLDGWAGVAIEGGQLDAQMVNSWLGPLQPLHIGGAGTADLRCFAMRADARGGVVTIEPVAMNTPALIVEGGGDVDLGHETLELRLRPRGKIGGTGIALPVRVSGPLNAPSAKVDISAKGLGGGLLLGGKDVMGAAGGGDPCPAALVRARAGAVPPEAIPSPGGSK